MSFRRRHLIAVISVRHDLLLLLMEDSDHHHWLHVSQQLIDVLGEFGSIGFDTVRGVAVPLFSIHLHLHLLEAKTVAADDEAKLALSLAGDASSFVQAPTGTAATVDRGDP